MDFKLADQSATTVFANVAKTILDFEVILAAIPMFFQMHHASKFVEEMYGKVEHTFSLGVKEQIGMILPWNT